MQVLTQQLLEDFQKTHNNIVRKVLYIKPKIHPQVQVSKISSNFHKIAQHQLLIERILHNNHKISNMIEALLEEININVEMHIYI